MSFSVVFSFLGEIILEVISQEVGDKVIEERRGMKLSKQE